MAHGANSMSNNPAGLLASTAIIQYSVAKFASTVGEVLAVTGTSDLPIGICQNDPATGEPADIVFHGEAKAIAGTSLITQGERLGFNSTGRVLDLALNTTTDIRPFVGFAMEKSAAAADFIRVFVNPSKGG